MILNPFVRCRRPLFSALAAFVAVSLSGCGLLSGRDPSQAQTGLAGVGLGHESPSPTALESVFDRHGINSLADFLANRQAQSEYHAALAEVFGGMSRCANFGLVIDDVKRVFSNDHDGVLAHAAWDTQDLGEPFELRFQRGEGEADRRIGAIGQELRQLLMAGNAQISLGIPAMRQFAEAKKQEFDVAASQTGDRGRAAQRAIGQYIGSIKSDSLAKAISLRSVYFALTRAENFDRMVTDFPETMDREKFLDHLLNVGLAEAEGDGVDFPKIDVVMKAAIAEHVPSQFKGEAKAVHEVTYRFNPIARRVHGIFKGLYTSECVGALATGLTAERWGTSLLEGAHVYYVTIQEGASEPHEAAGFLQTLPVRHRSGTRYRAVDVGIPKMQSQYTMIEGDRSLSAPGFALLFRELEARYPDEVPLKSDHQSDSAISSVIAAHPFWRTGKSLGGQEDFALAQTPIYEFLVANRSFVPDALKHSVGEMMYDLKGKAVSEVRIPNLGVIDVKEVPAEPGAEHRRVLKSELMALLQNYVARF